MRPLSDWHPPQGLIGVLTDIDDTLTTDGAITPDAHQALADLKAAGLLDREPPCELALPFSGDSE
jgi:hypothetical protein